MSSIDDTDSIATSNTIRSAPFNEELTSPGDSRASYPAVDPREILDVVNGIASASEAFQRNVMGVLREISKRLDELPTVSQFDKLVTRIEILEDHIRKCPGCRKAASV